MESDEQELARDALLEDNDDDLEFHITFPSPVQPLDLRGPPGTTAAAAGESSKSIAGAGEDSSNHEFVFLRPRIRGEDEPEPLVFLLGWMGCADKYLAKYSQVYEDLGCITIRYTAPAEYLALRPDKLQPLARKLLDLVEEMSLEASPILFHTFSNNGAALYAHMADLMRQEAEYDGVRRAVRGHVYDSGPGRRSLAGLLRAAGQVTAGGSLLYRLAVQLALLIYIAVTIIVGPVVDLVGGGSSGAGRGQWFFDRMKDDPLKWPLLFVHSSDDEMIAAADVDEFSSARERLGCDVSRVCYDQSPHCQHLRTHRESYVSSVCSFLNKCLDDGGGGGGTEEEPTPIQTSAAAAEESKTDR